MALYKVRLLSTAIKELRAIPKLQLRLVAAKISGLAANPRPHGAQKLSGEDRCRLRQGDWRIIYAIDDPGRRVLVVKIGHRKEVYR